MIDFVFSGWRHVLYALNCERPVIGGEAIEEWSPELLPELVNAGLLSELPPERIMSCSECPESPYRELIVTESQLIGRRVVFFCPNCGVYDIILDHLRRWQLDRSAFALLIREALGLSGSHGEVVPARLWRLGRLQHVHGNRSVWLGLRLSWRDANLVARVGWGQRGLLLVPGRAPQLELPDGIEIASLRELTNWSSAGIEFDRDWLEERLARGVPADSPKKPAPTRRQTRAADIEALVVELKQHLRAARDHAVHTRHTRGVPVLLPRPTQKELAQRLGITESRVSRSLNDPEAPQLQVLWELADDLDGVLRFG